MKQSKIKIGIITVNYNNPVDTIACINSFSDVGGKYKLNYFIVNNGCTDDSRNLISKEIKAATVIDSVVNLGFSGGNNLGIRMALKAGCTHILLINNDAKNNTKDFFDQLLKSPYDISSAVITTVGAKKNKNDYGGIVDWYFGRNTHQHSPGNIDYVSGACLFAKSEVFEKVGELDERFFLYYEDVDYCLRAKKIGFTVGVTPKAKITHILSSSTNKLGRKKILILAQSHLLFCYKHLSLLSLPLYLSFNLYLRLSAFFPKKRKS